MGQYTDFIYMDVGRFLYGLLTGILLIFGTDLLKRYIRADKRTRKDAAYQFFLVFALAIFGYGIYMFLGTMIDPFKEYINDPKRITYLEQIQILCILIILGIFAVEAEIILFGKKNVLYKNYMLMILILGFLIGLASALIAKNNPVNSGLQTVAVLIIALFALFGFFGIFHILLVKMAPQKIIKRKMQWGLLTTIIALGGVFVQFKMEPAWAEGTASLGWVIGLIVEISGWIIIREVFLSIPSYSEFDWKDGINEMHIIIAETGISLYYRLLSRILQSELEGDVKVEMKVSEEVLERRPNTDLVAGGLVGIKGMLSEISGEAGNLEHIAIGEKSLVFYQGESIMALLLADKNLGVYHSMLKELVAKIEESHDIEHFNGDTRVLKIAPIVEEIFDLPPEKPEE